MCLDSAIYVSDFKGYVVFSLYIQARKVHTVYSLVNRLLGAYKLISTACLPVFNLSIKPCVAPITSRSSHIFKDMVSSDDTISSLIEDMHSCVTSLLLQLLLVSAKWKWHGHTQSGCGKKNKRIIWLLSACSLTATHDKHKTRVYST